MKPALKLTIACLAALASPAMAQTSSNLAAGIWSSVVDTPEFIVPFDFGKSTLNLVGVQVVKEAAAYSIGARAVRVVVVGHTDAIGPSAYNIALSRRRALVVADALAELGVANDTLAVDWKGDSMPSSQAGVIPPAAQRRRVTIDPIPGDPTAPSP